MDSMHDQAGKTNENELELLNYEYGYIGWCIGNKKTAEARKYIDRGQQRIEKLMQKKFKVSMLHAYKSAFYGFEIGLNKAKAPFWGRKSIDEAKAYVNTMSAPELWDYFCKTEDFTLKDGKAIEGFMPDWIGEFYAYYQWYYNLPSSEVVKKVPVAFLEKAYGGLHDLELDLAVQKVGEV